MVELSMTNSTAYEEYIATVKRNDTTYLDYEMTRHNIYDIHRFDVLFA